jgi:alcohol dehydrogenase
VLRLPALPAVGAAADDQGAGSDRSLTTGIRSHRTVRCGVAVCLFGRERARQGSGAKAPGIGRTDEMKALVYHGPGRHSWEDVKDAQLVDPGDAVVRVEAVTICGTDLHILKGDVPAVTEGRILGHEAVGIVEEVGESVTTIKPGDRVLVSCISSCGRCRYCRVGRYGQCVGGGGWILGHLVDGTQAEYVRTPFADTSLYPLPDAISNESALLLADIFPTSYEVGVLNGKVTPGDTVVVVGAGPVGLAAIVTAKFFSPSKIVVIDKAASRLAAARRFGADVAISPDDNPVTKVFGLTGGLGADVAIEAVGVPSTFELCTELVRPGGRVANVGVHGEPVTLHLESLWIKDVTITTGLVDAYSTTTLMTMMASGQIDPAPFITHRFGLDEMMDAYDVFARAAQSDALKVALFRS